MIQQVHMNFKSLIFDSPDSDTINGIPAGYLSPTAAKLVGPDGKPQPLDIGRVIEHFHGKAGETSCVFSGQPADGLIVIDNNPQNILITNLAPVASGYMQTLPPLPRGFTTRTIAGPAFDLEVEIFGYLSFLANPALDKIQIPEVPADLGLAYDEAELLWIWKALTQKDLLKGLTKLKKCNRQTGQSVTLTNLSVLEFTMRMLQMDFKETQDDN